MQSFPLYPFLASLAADGIRVTVRDYERISTVLQTGGAWTLTRLRDVLLALLTKNEDQQEVFLRRFNTLFTLAPGAGDAFAEIDLQQALADLGQLAAQERQESRKPKPTEPFRKRVLKVIRKFRSKLGLGDEDEQDSEDLRQENRETHTHLEDDATEHHEAGISPEEEPAYWNPDGPRHFPLGSIGGKPEPRLSDETLGQLADSMGYFQSAQPGRRLNVSASIEITLRKGGIPALEFYTRKQIRSLLILEDALAEATLWNPIARELAEGMRQHGIPVVYGRFMRSPEQ